MRTREAVNERAASLVMPRGIRRRLRREVPEGARRLYVVGLLVADDNGRMAQADLDWGWHDQYIRETADRLMSEWGLT
jgi:hypothetical protein